MKVYELQMIQLDRVAEDARYIFALKVSQIKGDKLINYEKEASNAFLAAEAFYEIGQEKGHIQIKSVAP